MEFDEFTAVLLVLNPDSPDFSDAELDQLQDAHLAHLASLQESGQLLAAGPFPGEPDRYLRGLCVFGVDLDAAMELESGDPMVQAGRFQVVAAPWIVPTGVLSFGGRLPRSVADVQA